MNYQIYQNAKDINKAQWPQTSSNNPLLSQAFFQALEYSESATTDRGWTANHIVSDDLLVPAYLKTHSWGEYVFDHSWANTYQHYGYEYFPKLVATIPFTPVSCEKVLGSASYLKAFECMTNSCEEQQLSSWHMLFCYQQPELAENIVERLGVQFHWFNQGYNCFNDFLNKFSSRKRKNTRKERESIAAQGIKVQQLLGHQINEEQLDFFYLCYQLTYLKRGHQPHLTKRFFQQLISSIGDNMLLVIAEKEQEHVASALFFFDDENLYGRYWGSTEDIKNLHFELCYYQGIDFCIQNSLKRFNPGTQGEHKIQRGFQPVFVYSYHWLLKPAFRPAIKAFCQQEQNHIRQYFTECQTYLPFKENV